MTPVVERALTDDELAEVLTNIAEAETADHAIVGAVFGVFDLLLNDVGESTEDYTAERRIDGRNLRIPKSQWVAIGEALTERDKRDPLAKANLLLTWMNVGPSAIESA